MATTKMAMASGSAATPSESGLSPELARFDQEMRAFVKERPILALLGAITTGYVLGRILRRRG